MDALPLAARTRGAFRARGIADRLHALDIGIRDIRQILNPLRDVSATRHAIQCISLMARPFVSVSACLNHGLQILSDGAAFSGRARAVVGDHARRAPVTGQHDFRG